jgi:hypothetical protein
MQSRDYNDLDEVPEPVASTTAAAARNAVHMASALREQKYPPYQCCSFLQQLLRVVLP